MDALVRQHLERSIQTKQALLERCVSDIVRTGKRLASALEQGGRCCSVVMVALLPMHST